MWNDQWTVLSVSPSIICHSLLHPVSSSSSSPLTSDLWRLLPSSHREDEQVSASQELDCIKFFSFSLIDGYISLVMDTAAQRRWGFSPAHFSFLHILLKPRCEWFFFSADVQVPGRAALHQLLRGAVEDGSHRRAAAGLWWGSLCLFAFEDFLSRLINMDVIGQWNESRPFECQIIALSTLILDIFSFLGCCFFCIISFFLLQH